MSSPSLTVHLRFPRQHWKRIRHSNFIERTFGESRRRVKVIGRLPGETGCLSPVCPVLDRAVAAGGGSPKHRTPSGSSRICAGNCWNHRSISARTAKRAAARGRRQMPRPSAPELTLLVRLASARHRSIRALRAPAGHDGIERREGGPR